MKLTYVSEGGRVEMGGGSHPLINVIELSGFGLPTPDYDEIEYSGENGVTTIGKKDLARTMTISADLNGGQTELMKMLKVFYYPGELFCDFGNVKRKISCKCITPPDEIERNYNCGINTFTVQFKADYPYFSDCYDTTQSLAGYENLITTEFTLPCVFTKKLQNGECYNRGDLICYPVINIEARNEPVSADTLLVVSNSTTGATIEINFVMNLGEIVTIDLNTRRIKSSILGDITAHLAEGVDLSKFYLQKGKNEIAFSTSDTEQQLNANITFNNLYIMAVR